MRTLHRAEELCRAPQKQKAPFFALTLPRQTATNAETQVLRRVPWWALQPIARCENLRGCRQIYLQFAVRPRISVDKSYKTNL